MIRSFVISGVADNDINKSKIDVTQYLSSAPIYEEFEVPNTWSDGREFVQKGTVLNSRTDLCLIKKVIKATWIKFLKILDNI